MKMLPWLIPAISLVMSAAAAPTPTPAEKFPSDADIKKLPKEAIIATLKHQQQIFEDTKAERDELRDALMSAMKSNSIALVATGGALSKITDLTDQIRQVSDHDAKMTALANKYGKELNWYKWHSLLMKIATAVIILVIGVIAFLWFTGRLASYAAKVASKVP